MTADRDRLAADLAALLTERGAVFYGAVPTEGTDETIIADSLIALGWTRDPGGCGCSIHDDRGVPCPNHSDICAECHRVCWGSVYPLDGERLVRALTQATRAVGTKGRSDLHGRGWLVYSEWRNGHETTVTLLVNDLAAAIAKAYREDGG